MCIIIEYVYVCIYMCACIFYKSVSIQYFSHVLIKRFSVNNDLFYVAAKTFQRTNIDNASANRKASIFTTFFAEIK